MATSNLRSERGETIDYTPGSAVAAGQVVVQGDFVGVAKTPIAAGAAGALAVVGIFDVVKAAVAFTAGAAVFWDADGNPVGGTAGSGAATTSASGNKFMGFAVAAAGETDDDGPHLAAIGRIRRARETVGAWRPVRCGHGGLRRRQDPGGRRRQFRVGGRFGRCYAWRPDGAVTIGADKVLATHVKDGENLAVGVAVPDTKEITFGTSKLARSGNNIIATLPAADPTVCRCAVRRCGSGQGLGRDVSSDDGPASRMIGLVGGPADPACRVGSHLPPRQPVRRGLGHRGQDHLRGRRRLRGPGPPRVARLPDPGGRLGLRR